LEKDLTLSEQGHPIGVEESVVRAVGGDGHAQSLGHDVLDREEDPVLVRWVEVGIRLV